MSSGIPLSKTVFTFYENESNKILLQKRVYTPYILTFNGDFDVMYSYIRFNLMGHTDTVHPKNDDYVKSTFDIIYRGTRRTKCYSFCHLFASVY